MSHKSIEDIAYNQIKDFLPRALEKAIKNYEALLKTQPIGTDDSDIRALKMYQDACKVGVAHIELLIKMATNLPSEAKSGEDIDVIKDAWIDVFVKSDSDVTQFENNQPVDKPETK